MAVLGDYGGPFGVAVSDWNNGIAPWDFGVYANYYASAYNAYLYTDKPIYRPGQTVHIKGIVRTEDDARYAIDPNLKNIDVLIYDGQGKQVYTGTQPLNDYGTFNFDFALDQEAALGPYSIQAQIPVLYPGQEMPQIQYYNGTFMVSEYRRPEFQVTVTALKEEVLQGETVEVEAEATYFFGGAVSDAPVSWSVTANDYYFDRYEGQGYYGWNDVDYSGTSGYGRGGLIASGEGKTDKDGKFKITLPAKLDEKTGSQVFNVEAAITDLNDQQVAGRASVIVHQGQYYIGIAPADYVGAQGKPMDFNLLTVDWQGQPVGNKNVEVTYYQREWFNAQQVDDFGNIMWTWSYSDTAVFTATTTTDATGKGTSSFTPPTGGEYRVVARGTDDKGNKISSATYVWVSSQEYVSWRQDNNDRIALVADKKEYTARRCGEDSDSVAVSGTGARVGHHGTRSHPRREGDRSQDQQRSDRNSDHGGDGAQCVRVRRHRQGCRSKRSRAVVQDGLCVVQGQSRAARTGCETHARSGSQDRSLFAARYGDVHGEDFRLRGKTSGSGNVHGDGRSGGALAARSVEPADRGSILRRARPGHSHGRVAGLLGRSHQREVGGRGQGRRRRRGSGRWA